jgi:two-component system LytT family sensor kinase
MRSYALKRWAVILFAWGIFSAIQTTFVFNVRRLFSRPVPWLQVARMSFTQYFLIWGFLITPLAIWVCSRYPIERTNWRRRSLLHLGTSIGVSITISLLRLPLHHFVYPASAERVDWMLFRSYFFSNGFDDIIMYWFVAVICHSWMYYTRYKDRELRASQLEAMLTRSQLQLLRMQLHPHFLFNTLHSISELMHQNVTAADDMINRLSDLLRMTLENNGLQEVPLKKELEFLDGYVGIEQVRFGDRLRMLYEIAPETLDAQVPSMMLQPLLENAIRHGIALHSGAGLIELRSHLLRGTLNLLLRNSSPGPENGDEVAGFGIGFRNTRERLTQLYGSGYSFEFRNRNGVVEVEIRVPFSTQPRLSSSTVLTENVQSRRILQQVGP